LSAMIDNIFNFLLHNLGLNTAANDLSSIHTSFKQKTDDLLNNDKDLLEYSKQVENLESKISIFLENKINKFSSKEDAQKALDDLEQLSTQTTVLAKIMAYLASQHAENVNKSYNNTINTISRTILRLSDDIGKMADRIGEMAEQIGIMADRIVQTQEIQSKNYNATLQLTQYALRLSSEQMNVYNNTAIYPMQNSINSMSNVNMQQGTIKMH